MTIAIEVFKGLFVLALMLVVMLPALLIIGLAGAVSVIVLVVGGDRGAVATMGVVIAVVGLTLFLAGCNVRTCDERHAGYCPPDKTVVIECPDCRAAAVGI